MVLGALCCHSEINELDEISAWILHSSIIAAQTGRLIFSGLEEAWRMLWEVVLQEYTCSAVRWHNYDLLVRSSSSNSALIL